MPRRTAARNTPGTERYRDERRGGGPRMEGRQWHDYDSPKEMEPEAMAGAGAVMEGEGSPDHEGIGRTRKKSATSKPTPRRKRMTPVGKGPKAKTRNAKGGRRGAKRTGMSGNPG